MHVSATEAKNRLGQMLERCQQEPVVIEKSGRRHSVLISAVQYDALVAAQCPASTSGDPARDFYEKYKEWVDEQQRHFEDYGIWNEEFRTW
jgi:prevent-host-death family protein